MKKFLMENFWWLLLAVVTIGCVVGIAYIPDESWVRKLFLSPFYIIAAITILKGIGEVIQSLEEKNFFKQTWQGILTFIILVFSIVVLVI